MHLLGYPIMHCHLSGKNAMHGKDGVILFFGPQIRNQKSSVLCINAEVYTSLTTSCFFTNVSSLMLSEKSLQQSVIFTLILFENPLLLL